MLNPKIKQILDNCKEAYSNGDMYTFTQDDKAAIEEFLGVIIAENLVTDPVFDEIYYKAKEVFKDEYFNALTSNNTGFGNDIKHELPMGSMEELKSGDWDKWNKSHKEYWVSSKLDGCSLILTYINGKLEVAATRGHGIKGKDCMRHIPFITNIPNTIPYKDKIIIRGELICPKAEIAGMIEEVEFKTGLKLKNGRNTIAGALNKKETMKDIFKHLHFVAYWDSLHNAQDLNWIKGLGFEIPLLETISNSTTEEDLLELVKSHIAKANYELDGIIITQKDNPEQGFETGTINPKASRKFKMGINVSCKETKLIDIEWNVTKTGRLCPRVIFEPIELDGSVIQKATGVNKDFLEKLGVFPGCTLVIRKAGAVIPQIVTVSNPLSNYTRLDQTLLPKVAYTEKGLDLYIIPTEENAYLKQIKQLAYFCKKLNLDQLGINNCKTLFYRYHELNPEVFLIGPALFGLDEGFFIAALGENGKKAYASVNNIKDKLTIPMIADACGDFSFGMGEKVLEKIYEKYNSLNITNKQQLLDVEGISEKRAEQFIEHVPDWLASYNLLIVNGITFDKKTKSTVASSMLSEYTICFTGVRDKDFEQYIIENGGKISDGWKKNVNLLVAKDPSSNSSKIEKARKANCKVLSLEETYKLLGYK